MHLVHYFSRLLALNENQRNFMLAIRQSDRIRSGRSSNCRVHGINMHGHISQHGQRHLIIDDITAMIDNC
ncbi:hypothetical protein BpHYR1_004929 [Brachionus plicatilis]|uniref:Uncharacterized protein n=1 Tax=Brachionus plicatilis TaxID=10195 RepID=A0A3M7S1E6_BRAPC|nr:hypothetical protein BpHYR1_004929 [Brachionus plicatilis]